MKTLALVILAVSFFVGCASQSAPTNATFANANANKTADSRKEGDLAIYGGLPSMPSKPFPAQLKRKTPHTPTALCNDENYSFSRNVDFTCIGHGGVKQWLYDSDVQIKTTDPRYFED